MTIKHRFAVLLIEMHEHFRVAVRAKGVTRGQQVVPQLDVVVNLPVEHQVQAIEVHGLIGTRTQVNNGKQAVAEAYQGFVDSVNGRALPIGTPVHQRSRHLLQNGFVASSLKIYKSGNAAHGLTV